MFIQSSHLTPITILKWSIIVHKLPKSAQELRLRGRNHRYIGKKIKTQIKEWYRTLALYQANKSKYLVQFCRGKEMKQVKTVKAGRGVLIQGINKIKDNLWLPQWWLLKEQILPTQAPWRANLKTLSKDYISLILA